MSTTSTPTASTARTRPAASSSLRHGSIAVGTNLVVVRGTLRADPERRGLATGDDVLVCDLIVHVDEGPSESVPVLWEEPPAAAGRLVADLDVVVIGRVRRRFFRVGGATATRTEVHADSIVPVRAGATLRRTLDLALGSLLGA